MLSLLTTYLFQFRTVTIPNVGTIRLTTSSAEVETVNQLIAPPSYSAQINKDENIADHQLRYLGDWLQLEEQEVLTSLKAFGNDLHEKINGPGFEWRGLGHFTRSTQSFPLPLNGLNYVRAEKVLRAQPEHKVLVGDKETTSLQLAEEKALEEQPVKKNPVLTTIAWILLALSIAAIVLLLVLGKFNVNSTGSRQTVAEYQMSLSRAKSA